MTSENQDFVEPEHADLHPGWAGNFWTCSSFLFSSSLGNSVEAVSWVVSYSLWGSELLFPSPDSALPTSAVVVEALFQLNESRILEEVIKEIIWFRESWGRGAFLYLRFLESLWVLLKQNVFCTAEIQRKWCEWSKNPSAVMGWFL